MGTVKGKGKPQGFRRLPEGEQILHLSNVTGIPRANIKQVTIKMVNEEGLGFDKYPQKYDLETDGGYAAFYYLVKGILGIDLDEGDEFDIDQLEDTYGLFEIVYKDNPNNPDSPYVNISKCLGSVDGFEGDAAPSGDDDDYE